MKKVASFAEACNDRGCNPEIMPGLEGIPERFHAAITNHYKLMVLTEAVNEGQEPDWSNTDQRKWFPVFSVDKSDTKPSGFGLSLDVSYYGCTGTTVGSRLTSVTEEASTYLAETFTPEYEGAFLKG